MKPDEKERAEITGRAVAALIFVALAIVAWAIWETVKMDGGGMVESFVVVFREGLEALLVVVTLAALLEAKSESKLLKYVYWAAMAAVVAASLVVFASAMTHYDNPVFDALILSFSAGVMIYMARDLFLWRWRNPAIGAAKKVSLEERTVTAIAKSGAFGVSALTFSVVFREGLESAVFLHATSIAQGGWTGGMLWGVHAALVLLVAAYFAIKHATCKLPVRYIIAATSASFLIQAGMMLREVFL